MKKPSKALLNDLRDVFQKHNWPGHAIGIEIPKDEDHVAENAAENLVAHAKHNCPPGKTWKPYYYQKADGTVVFAYHCG